LRQRLSNLGIDTHTNLVRRNRTLVRFLIPGSCVRVAPGAFTFQLVSVPPATHLTPEVSKMSPRHFKSIGLVQCDKKKRKHPKEQHEHRNKLYPVHPRLPGSRFPAELFKLYVVAVDHVLQIQFELFDVLGSMDFFEDYGSCQRGFFESTKFISFHHLG